MIPEPGLEINSFQRDFLLNLKDFRQSPKSRKSMNLETSQRQSRTMEMHAENARRNNGNARRKCWNTVKMYAKKH